MLVRKGEDGGGGRGLNKEESLGRPGLTFLVLCNDGWISGSEDFWNGYYFILFIYVNYKWFLLIIIY